MSDHATPDAEQGQEPDLDDLDAHVLEDLDADEDADDVRGGLHSSFCRTR